MRAVNRGPEPAGLKAVRKRRTPRWVNYYRHGSGRKPTDGDWRGFQPDVSKVFFDLCAYCEEYCKGDVDHFRPKARYPHLVYEWTNWVLACPTCNNSKSDKWPSGGYVDPCARTRRAQPEAYFVFDTHIYHIVPRPGLSPRRRKKAEQMIADLKLNNYHHLKRRALWLTAVGKGLEAGPPTSPGHDAFVQCVSSRERELSSMTSQFLREQGLL